jgi:DNA-3-methyladenine glycosylase
VRNGSTNVEIDIGGWRARRIERAFFERDARVVARALLGSVLVVAKDGEPARAVRIVETEAYCGPKDLACHARVGLTNRTKTLLGPPGRAYVYLIYGMYDCFNVTCLREGAGHAVLVRAGEPIAGVADGARADGPGRLTRAMGITRKDDGADLVEGAMFLVDREARPRVTVTARVGVGYSGAWAEKPWRFFDRASAHVSRPSKKTIGLGA